jgi:hypothetical protein
MKITLTTTLSLALFLLPGCNGKSRPEPPSVQPAPVAAAPVYFHIDPATAGVLRGTIHYTGKRPARQLIDMSEDPACVEAHHGRAYDESLVVNPNDTLANVFVYIKSGLEGKTFEIPTTPVTIDQRGCWFHPRVLGIQTGQILSVINSDPVTHNIHPLAEVNREWNHSQGQGDPPLARKFMKPEPMDPSRFETFRRAITSSQPGRKPWAHKSRRSPFSRQGKPQRASPSKENNS